MHPASRPLLLVAVLVAGTLTAVAGGAAATAGQSGAGVASAPAADAPSENTSGAGTAPSTDATATGTATAPPDPPSDRLGWEGGYWHNETITVDRSDGLNDTELDRVVARAMARVEYVRGLEFERQVPVRVISRERFSNDTARQYRNTSRGDRLHQNVKFEALFFVPEGESAVSNQQSTRSASVGGYYSFANESIVIVSEDTESPQMDEITLSQELFHALQDRKFDVRSLNRTTLELYNARNGIVEGDGNYVDYLYQQRCEGIWNGTCLLPNRGGSGGGDGNESGGGDRDVNVGMLYLRYQAYSDGPAFVRGLRQQAGWDAVADVYADPPASSEQVIHPETYPAEEPRNVTVPDRSGQAWSVPETSGEVNHAAFGEAGAYMLLWYPGYQSRGVTQIIPYTSFLNFEVGGQAPDIDPFNYSHPYTTGWDGDVLKPYAREDSLRTNETGYVWKLAWDSRRDAKQFAGAYRDLLRFHGAERVGRRTWRIPSGGYADAFHVNRTGTTVVVTNAPTVEALSAVRSTVSVDRSFQTTTAPTPTTGAGEDTDATTTPGTSSGAVPGFTAVTALVALALVALSTLALGGRGRRP